MFDRGAGGGARRAGATKVLAPIAVARTNRLIAGGFLRAAALGWGGASNIARSFCRSQTPLCGLIALPVLHQPATFNHLPRQCCPACRLAAARGDRRGLRAAPKSRRCGPAVRLEHAGVRTMELVMASPAPAPRNVPERSLLERVLLPPVRAGRPAPRRCDEH